MRYALLLHNYEPAPGELPEEGIAEMEGLFDAYGKALEAAGVLVGADILQFSHATTTITRRTGTTQVQDGPFAETKEALAGVFIIDVPDADAALAWAEKCPGASYGSIGSARWRRPCPAAPGPRTARREPLPRRGGRSSGTGRLRPTRRAARGRRR